MSFDQNDFEDEAWGSPGVLGIVAAVLIVAIVASAGAWFDAHQGVFAAFGIGR